MPWIALATFWFALSHAPTAFSDTEIQFEERDDHSEAWFVHNASKTRRKYLLEAMGTGVAAFDYDADGRLDLYLVNGANLSSSPEDLIKSDPKHWNRLYRNLGDWRFGDVTVSAGVAGRGYGMGVAVADYDGDSHPDLFVSNFGPDILYRNQGDGTFQDVTASAGISSDGWSAGAAFLDFDRDGWLDLFVAQYLDWTVATSRPCGDRPPDHPSYCHPRKYKAVRHRLYRNSGTGRFEDISSRVGLDDQPGKGLGVAVNDLDGDGWTDIFVANDSYPQQLFRNNRGRQLSEVAILSGAAFDSEGRDYAGMGVAWQDYDGDSRPDILVNALGRQGYWLYRNTGGAFETRSAASGLAAFSGLRSGWGMGLVDFDNDGWRDLFVAQGHVMDDIQDTDPALAHEEPLLVARNLFGRFFDVSKSAGPVFRKAFAARGAAFGDFDGDDRVDIAVAVNDGQALLLKNTSAAGENITVRLRGSRPNRDAIGAMVQVKDSSGRVQSAFRGSGGSYLSASSPDLHFGLGLGSQCESVTVTWPDGSQQSVLAPDLGLLVIHQDPAPSDSDR